MKLNDYLDDKGNFNHLKFHRDKQTAVGFRDYVQLGKLELIGREWQEEANRLYELQQRTFADGTVHDTKITLEDIRTHHTGKIATEFHIPLSEVVRFAMRLQEFAEEYSERYHSDSSDIERGGW